MQMDAAIAERAGIGADSAGELFRLLVASVTDYAIFVLDPAGHVASWNPGAERIKGYAAAEILGRHFSLFYSHEERAAGEPAMALARAEREVLVQADSAALRKDGTRFFLSSGPYHSHWFRPAETRSFAARLRRLGVPVQTLFTSSLKGEWRTQFDAGLTWALHRQ